MPHAPGYHRTILDSTRGTVALGLILTVVMAVLARVLALGHP